MSKRYNEINIKHFANLVKEINVSKYTQKEYRKIVEEIYMTIFRHNTDGEYVIETMPNEEGTWKIHNKGQTIEQAMEIINERK
jgi:hypothetical protein|tara:strand:+ start:121 stop:369 length:249 start_codon:yes stop_codon:yes gene_type:complete